MSARDGEAPRLLTVARGGEYVRVADPGWKDPLSGEYARRVGAVMDFLSADGRTLVWVGIPNAKSGDFRDRLEILD